MSRITIDPTFNSDGFSSSDGFQLLMVIEATPGIRKILPIVSSHCSNVQSSDGLMGNILELVIISAEPFTSGVTKIRWFVRPGFNFDAASGGMQTASIGLTFVIISEVIGRYSCTNSQAGRLPNPRLLSEPHDDAPLWLSAANAIIYSPEEVTDMAHTETTKFEGTPEQLAGWLGRLSNGKRYRITEIDGPEPEITVAPPPACRRWVSMRLCPVGRKSLPRRSKRR